MRDCTAEHSILDDVFLHGFQFNLENPSNLYSSADRGRSAKSTLNGHKEKCFGLTRSGRSAAVWPGCSASVISGHAAADAIGEVVGIKRFIAMQGEQTVRSNTGHARQSHQGCMSW